MAGSERHCAKRVWNESIARVRISRASGLNGGHHALLSWGTVQRAGVGHALLAECGVRCQQPTPSRSLQRRIEPMAGRRKGYCAASHVDEFRAACPGGGNRLLLQRFRGSGLGQGQAARCVTAVPRRQSKIVVELKTIRSASRLLFPGKRPSTRTVDAPVSGGTL